jgi:hypothetical protein
MRLLDRCPVAPSFPGEGRLSTLEHAGAGRADRCGLSSGS